MTSLHWVILLILLLTACKPVPEIKEPDKKPAIEQPVVPEKIENSTSSVKEEPVKQPAIDWDCSATDNDVINTWKRIFKCNGKLDGE